MITELTRDAINGMRMGAHDYSPVDRAYIESICGAALLLVDERDTLAAALAAAQEREAKYEQLRQEIRHEVRGNDWQFMPRTKAALDLLVTPPPAAAPGAVQTPDRETLGRMVRDVWLEHQRAKPHPKPENLRPWDELDEGAKEVEMKMGERLYWAGVRGAAPGGVREQAEQRVIVAARAYRESVVAIGESASEQGAMQREMFAAIDALEWESLPQERRDILTDDARTILGLPTAPPAEEPARQQAPHPTERAASDLAMMMLVDSLNKGNTVEIPSLGITLTKDDLRADLRAAPHAGTGETEE